MLSLRQWFFNKLQEVEGERCISKFKKEPSAVAFLKQEKVKGFGKKMIQDERVINHISWPAKRLKPSAKIKVFYAKPYGKIILKKE